MQNNSQSPHFSTTSIYLFFVILLLSTNVANATENDFQTQLNQAITQAQSDQALAGFMDAVEAKGLLDVPDEERQLRCQKVKQVILAKSDPELRKEIAAANAQNISKDMQTKEDIYQFIQKGQKKQLQKMQNESAQLSAEQETAKLELQQQKLEQQLRSQGVSEELMAAMTANANLVKQNTPTAIQHLQSFVGKMQEHIQPTDPQKAATLKQAIMASIDMEGIKKHQAQMSQFIAGFQIEAVAPLLYKGMHCEDFESTTAD